MINTNSNIFVSTANVQPPSVLKSVDMLADEGIINIELSGGIFEKDVNKKLAKYKGVLFQLHHYFPPPVEPFVINLASGNAFRRT